MLLRLSRRAALTLPAFASLAACSREGAVASAPEALTREAALPATAPLLVMITAPDCPFCQQFASFYRPAFEQSPERARIRFLVLETTSLRLGHADRAWPQEHRWIRDARVERGMAGGTPSFNLVRGREVLLLSFCLGEWGRAMRPRIRREVGIA